MLSTEKKKMLVDYWKEGAVEDLETAKDIASSAKRFPAALFYAHLSVEKLLKAAYVEAMSDHAPYTHNLLHLVAKLGWQANDDMIRKLAEVNEFNLEGRYPDQKRAFRQKATARFTETQLLAVEELHQWILEKSKDGC